MSADDVLCAGDTDTSEHPLRLVTSGTKTFIMHDVAVLQVQPPHHKHSYFGVDTIAGERVFVPEVIVQRRCSDESASLAPTTPSADTDEDQDLHEILAAAEGQLSGHSMR